MNQRRVFGSAVAIFVALMMWLHSSDAVEYCGDRYLSYETDATLYFVKNRNVIPFDLATRTWLPTLDLGFDVWGFAEVGDQYAFSHYEGSSYWSYYLFDPVTETSELQTRQRYLDGQFITPFDDQLIFLSSGDVLKLNGWSSFGYWWGSNVSVIGNTAVWGSSPFLWKIDAQGNIDETVGLGLWGGDSRAWLSDDRQRILQGHGAILDSITLEPLGRVEISDGKAATWVGDEIVAVSDYSRLLTWYDREYLEVGHLSEPSDICSLHDLGGTLLVFFEDGLNIDFIELDRSDFIPRVYGPPVDPAGLAFEPERALEHDGVVYLLDAELGIIVRWDLATRDYLPTIPAPTGLNQQRVDFIFDEYDALWILDEGFQLYKGEAPAFQISQLGTVFGDEIMPVDDRLMSRSATRIFLYDLDGQLVGWEPKPVDYQDLDFGYWDAEDRRMYGGGNLCSHAMPAPGVFENPICGSQKAFWEDEKLRISPNKDRIATSSGFVWSLPNHEFMTYIGEDRRIDDFRFVGNRSVMLRRQRDIELRNGIYFSVLFGTAQVPGWALALFSDPEPGWFNVLSLYEEVPTFFRREIGVAEVTLNSPSPPLSTDAASPVEILFSVDYQGSIARDIDIRVELAWLPTSIDLAGSDQCSTPAFGGAIHTGFPIWVSTCSVSNVLPAENRQIVLEVVPGQIGDLQIALRADSNAFETDLSDNEASIEFATQAGVTASVSSQLLEGDSTTVTVQLAAPLAEGRSYTPFISLVEGLSSPLDLEFDSFPNYLDPGTQSFEMNLTAHLDGVAENPIETYELDLFWPTDWIAPTDPVLIEVVDIDQPVSLVTGTTIACHRPGNVLVPVAIDRLVDQPLWVPYEVGAFGDAIVGDDFAYSTGVVYFWDSTQPRVSVAVLDYGLGGENRTVGISFSQPDDYTLQLADAELVLEGNPTGDLFVDCRLDAADAAFAILVNDSGPLVNPGGDCIVDDLLDSADIGCFLGEIFAP